jgi:hypothetical protein
MGGEESGLRGFRCAVTARDPSASAPVVPVVETVGAVVTVEPVVTVVTVESVTPDGACTSDAPAAGATSTRAPKSRGAVA